jgi:hypothetical protein
LAAVTRDVPAHGEASFSDERWLGSVRWRELHASLRALPITDERLRLQWTTFLDVLDEEGSMGFTKPDPELFAAWSVIRRAGDHAEDFLKTLQLPLLDRLRAALGGGDGAADFYRKQRGRGGPVISKSWNGIVDLPFRVPADGSPSIRAGIFAYNPPTRFYVAPQHGRRLAAKRHRLPARGQEAVERLVQRGFREYDLHAFLNLDDDLLASRELEEHVVEWSHARFVDLVASRLLELQHTVGTAAGADEAEPDEDAEDA